MFMVILLSFSYFVLCLFILLVFYVYVVFNQLYFSFRYFSIELNFILNENDTFFFHWQLAEISLNTVYVF